MRKTLFHFLVPGGLLAVLAGILLLAVELPPAVRAFLPYFPAIVLAAGLFLGWRFNRSRLVFALLVLTLADRALALWPEAAAVAPAVRILLPLNLALIAGYGERGLLTPLGLARLGLIALQPAAIAVLMQQRPKLLPALLQRPLLPALPADLLPGDLSQPALAALVLAAAWLLWRFLLSPGPLAGGFLWALPVACLPLALPALDPTLWLAWAGLILVTAVLETSYGMAFRDELTGLPARRALNEALLKVGRRYTLAMVDVDHFKKVNDRFGHDIGDQVLKMVAGRLSRVSGGGQAFRYGGEEFTVLFAGKGSEDALPHLEALREAIADSGFTIRHRSRPKTTPKAPPKKVGDRRLSVTVSIGVADRQGDLGQPAEVIKAADQALYRAKQTGRNRVCCAGTKGARAVRGSR